MSLCGYISSTGSAVVQSQSAINSIINIYMFGPLLIFVGVLIVGLLYPVHIFGMEFEICQQGLALLALIPIWLYRGRQGYHSKPFQYACYAFYPVHMLILVLILQYLTR